MTVADLIKRLSRFDPTLSVHVNDYDGGVYFENIDLVEYFPDEEGDPEAIVLLVS